MKRRNRMLLLVATLGFVAGTMGCQSSDGPLNRTDVRDGVFVHLSKGAEDPHAVSMALKMADLMAADRDVLVYCDLKGINVVLQDAPDIRFPTFDSSRTQIKALMGRSVPIYACPGCLKALGKTPGDLMPGVRVAEKEAFFSFTKGRILTLDY